MKKDKRSNVSLNKPVRILIGLATIWYTVYLLLTILAIVTIFGYIFTSLMTGTASVANLRALLMELLSLEIMLPFHVCSLGLEVGLLIFYLVHTLLNKKASDALRIGLGLGHLFLPFVAMPVYYYLYIWQDSPPEWAIAKTTQIDGLAQNVV